MCKLFLNYYIGTVKVAVYRFNFNGVRIAVNKLAVVGHSAEKQALSAVAIGLFHLYRTVLLVDINYVKSVVRLNGNGNTF